MPVRWFKRVAGMTAVVSVAACASIFSGTESTVQIHTKPDHARCELTGRDGFTLSVDTPAGVKLPSSAAPVTVACTAPGYRRLVATLDASADGWVWANSAFMAATGGAAVLGLIVDESRGAGMTFQKDVTYGLEAEHPRPVKTLQRNGGLRMELEAR
jgi:hypothetical protein